MYYKDCQVKENKMTGPYHKNDNGGKFHTDIWWRKRKKRDQLRRGL